MGPRRRTRSSEHALVLQLIEVVQLLFIMLSSSVAVYVNRLGGRRGGSQKASMRTLSAALCCLAQS